VDRKKPKLTSPWKVGFLVALLLVVTALGVSYFITGTFGITWHWIQFGGLSPMTWTFDALVEAAAALCDNSALGRPARFWSSTVARPKPSWSGS